MERAKRPNRRDKAVRNKIKIPRQFLLVENPYLRRHSHRQKTTAAISDMLLIQQKNHVKDVFTNLTLKNKQA